MPLLDHFHAPLRKRRHWDSFHSSWTTFIARQRNKKPLPAGFVVNVAGYLAGALQEGRLSASSGTPARRETVR